MKTLYAARFARVTENLARQGLTQMIVSDPPTIFYLTGVRIQPGERMLALLLRADGNHRFFVNALFGTPEAGIPVENYSDGEDAPAKLLPWLERDKPLGIDKNWPARFLLRLMELDAVPAYRNASAACDDARAVKDAAEQEAMRASSKVNDDCMAEFEALIRPGITEKEMADAIRGIYAAHGCSGVSFPPICGFGAHAADPHHDNDDTPLEAGQCVLIDVGGVYQDYCSDMTRTFFTGEPSEEERKVYELVRQAQAAAEAAGDTARQRLPALEQSARDAAAQLEETRQDLADTVKYRQTLEENEKQLGNIRSYVWNGGRSRSFYNSEELSIARMPPMRRMTTQEIVFGIIFCLMRRRIL